VISFIHDLEHFSNNDYSILFEYIKYYLNTVVVFTGALPNNLRFNHRICPECGHKFEIDGHLSRHTKETLINLFNTYDFEIIHLNDFNYHYYKKHQGIFKYFYRILTHKILNVPQKGQLEYIVKPIVK
jgi:hypothetical protein